MPPSLKSGGATDPPGSAAYGGSTGAFVKFWIFAPNMHFTPSMPPHRNFSVPHQVWIIQIQWHNQKKQEGWHPSPQKRTIQKDHPLTFPTFLLWSPTPLQLKFLGTTLLQFQFQGLWTKGLICSIHAYRNVNVHNRKLTFELSSKLGIYPLQVPMPTLDKPNQVHLFELDIGTASVLTLNVFNLDFISWICDIAEFWYNQV